MVYLVIYPQNFNFWSNHSVYITFTLSIWSKFGCLGVVNLDVDIDQLLNLYGDSYWRTFWESCKGEMQKGGEGGHVFLVKTEKSDNMNDLPD